MPEATAGFESQLRKTGFRQLWEELLNKYNRNGREDELLVEEVQKLIQQAWRVISWWTSSKRGTSIEQTSNERELGSQPR